jgi:DNA-directed RNA polymerase subunit RPC12/RpoP
VEEDELGLQHVIGHTEYVSCSRCGAAIPQREASAVPADALEVPADFEYLCANCRAELADGEKDLPEPEI